MINIHKILKVADVALRFGKVDRATMHPDGSLESDATHTTMLGLVAVEEPPPELDPGKLLSFILVHDLVETFALDTNTAWGLSQDERAAKDARERAAVEKLRALGLTRIVALIEEYERQDTPEARWVRYVDKVMPKLTHVLNGGRALEKIGMKRSDMLAKHEQQGRELADRYPDQAHARELFEAATALCEHMLFCDAENADSVLETDRCRAEVASILQSTRVQHFMLGALRKSANTPEPTPLQSAGPAVWDLVIDDLAGTGILSRTTLDLIRPADREQLIMDGRERDRFGAEKYGTRLRVGNGRNSIADAYQEVLDLAVYMRQAVQEAPSTSAWGKAMTVYRCAVVMAADLRFMLTENGWSSSELLPSDTLRHIAGGVARSADGDVYDLAASWIFDMFDTGMIAESISGVDGLAWCEACGEWVVVKIEQTQGDDVEFCGTCHCFVTDHGLIDARAVAAGLRMRYPDPASRDQLLALCRITCSAVEQIELLAKGAAVQHDRYEVVALEEQRAAEDLLVFAGTTELELRANVIERDVDRHGEALARLLADVEEENAALEKKLAEARAEIEIMRKVAGRTLETTPQPLPIGWQVGMLHGSERGLIGPNGSIMLDDIGNIAVAGRVPLHVSEAFARLWRRLHGWPSSAHEWTPIGEDGAHVGAHRFQCARCLVEVDDSDGGDDSVGPGPGVSAAGLCSTCWCELDSGDPRVMLVSATEQIKAHEQAASRMVCPISKLGNAHLAWSPGTGDSPAEGWHYLFGGRGYSYTLAEIDDGGDMIRWRFDEDEAQWCEAEVTGKHVVDEDEAEAAIVEIERLQASNAQLTAERDDARRSLVRMSLSKWSGPGRPTPREHAEFYFPGQGAVLFP